MQISIRQGKVPGKSLPEQLSWMESMGTDGIELHGDALQMKQTRRRIGTRARAFSSGACITAPTRGS